MIVGAYQTEKTYVPELLYQSEIDFTLYASDLKSPKYVDISCTPVGSMTIDISEVPGDEIADKEVIVGLIFGDTEIKATAEVKKTGQAVSATFDFLG